MLLPSIMRRIDDFLLVKELDATFFDHAVREDLLHIAICTPSAGLEYDYERLELLGKILYITLCWCLIFFRRCIFKVPVFDIRFRHEPITQ